MCNNSFEIEYRCVKNCIFMISNLLSGSATYAKKFENYLL